MGLNLKEAASLIRSSETVAFPTETVYGLGADATSEVAISKIFNLKNRPYSNPLIIHVANIEQAEKFAHITMEVELLFKSFSPGPLSVVTSLKDHNYIARQATAGLDTVAIRIPKNKIALELIKLSGVPIAAPSANLSGKISSTLSEHVRNYFGQDFPILENDEKHYEFYSGKSSYYDNVGLESTVIDVSQAPPTLLRHGSITRDMLESVLGMDIANIDENSENKIYKSPGMSYKHYSPSVPMRLNANYPNADEVFLSFGGLNPNETNCEYSLNLSPTEDLIEAARNLYSMLISLDIYASRYGKSCIAVSPIPNESIGIAINDRLNRAAK
jgi:L-threonylcarbamoyladenylate synthase